MATLPEELAIGSLSWLINESVNLCWKEIVLRMYLLAIKTCSFCQQIHITPAWYQCYPWHYPMNIILFQNTNTLEFIVPTQPIGYLRVNQTQNCLGSRLVEFLITPQPASECRGNHRPDGGTLMGKLMSTVHCHTAHCRPDLQCALDRGITN